MSESGTISRIEVVNFMCHKYLKMDFGPKINFVIGHNGSGKSAILTALIVALGAKANSTNRGKNLSSLIREGTNASLVTIHITNKGPDAYKHSTYGDCIIVDRRILRDGSNSFKIKDYKGKVISNKREELTAICDHMSIQVDNPLTMLSQDSARQFLNSSSSHDKYKLFMRGTQLAQLANDFDKIRETLEITNETIKRKLEHVPALHRKAKEAEARYKELLSTSEIDVQIDDLNNELVWSQIIRKEMELEKARKIANLSQDNIDESDQQVQAAQGKIEKLNEEIAHMQLQMKDYKDKHPVDSETRNHLNARNAACQQKSNEIKRDMADTNIEFKRCNSDLKKYDREISLAKDKLESNNREKIERINDNIERLETSKEKLLEQSRGLETKRQDLQRAIEEERNTTGELKEALGRTQKTFRDAQGDVTRLKEQRENKLKAFGNRMPEVLQAIANEQRWRGQPPVGPFGQYMNLKYPEFAEVLEITLGNNLSSFAVETFEDQSLLRAILRRNGLEKCNIMVAKKDMFDYSADEPDSDLLTILQAIDFDDEYVKRQLVISNSIHQVVLMQERLDAENLMAGHPQNVKACLTKNCQNVGSKTGLRTESLRRHRGPIRFNKDVEEEMKKLSMDGRALRNSVNESEGKCKALYNELEDVKVKLKRVGLNITKHNQEIENLQENLREREPVNLSSLEQDKEECERLLKRFIDTFKGLKSDAAMLREEMNHIQSEIDKIDDEEEEHNEHLAHFREEIHKLEGLLHSQESKLVDYQTTRDNRRSRHAINVQAREQLENTVAEWTSEAIQDYPTRVNTTRNSDEIQREIGHLEKQLDEKEKAAGMTIEEAEKEASRAVTEYTDVKDTISSMEGFLKRMNESLLKRMDQWAAFLTYIPLSAKGYFRYYMHKRGDNGTLKFSHTKQTLDVRVTTGDQFKEGTERRKDSKSLSGGEKSFSQISLLLSLWNGISSPILCLDEFDVYMDAVNRKQSMKMMMEAAYETSSQYILITPQDASNMVPGPQVTVHRMADPERGK
ncbi:hypothetical protein BCR42DRAFT_331345 [Absidia repens]|uniref:RecF/RecN/SMC N-terminal domain-containing protein n=1 Tax=Absidia repens TaxID=90262 RepID=A0A1X2IAB7_9FUNG|nr:hypothetical protein BCR42DRAFT_331345 [Absidia repens]